MRPTVRILGRDIHMFRVCGIAGLALAAPVALRLADAGGGSVATEAGLIVLAIGVFFAVARATRAITGRASLTYYHHEVAVLGSVWVVLALAGETAAPYLDATAVGLGAFLACGRIGCLFAGCCHGRPARRGVRYPQDSLVARGLVGVRLLPVQAFEAAAAALLAAAGAVLVLTGAAAGTAAITYVAGYAVVRFGLEELRGDPNRPRLGGLSEAQWTSAVIVVALLGPYSLVAVAVAVVLLRHRRALPARPLCALADALDGLPTTDGAVALREVDGVRVSAGRTAGVVHYTVSGPREILQGAAAVEDLVARLRHPGSQATAVAADGVLHVLVQGAP